MNQKLRQQLATRAQGWCEKCGGWTGDTFAAHHRKLKSQGGKDHIQNLVALCHPCHNLGTHAIHLNPKQAVAGGWIVPVWADPAHTPICPDDGTTLELKENGTKLQGE
jgi:hypothetical protein